ncbi:MAG: LysM peptidoglycan-binding domain-containing protein [Hyalangium sp.]|uniref:LysM peptidoglycan-binding domain-containing protein n=1 Tax=Hyalangium sp. TaxID=2028555 RepID=UPI00389AA71F
MSTYRIRSGDTLSAIASRFHTSVSALARTNHIANPNLIYAGKSLSIPGHSGSSSFEPAKGGGTHSSGGTSAGRTGGSTGTDSVGTTTGAGGIKVTPAMRKLAAAGHTAAMGMGGYNSQGLCATGVSRAIQSALGLSVHGNGNQIDNNLPRNKFKQVNIPLSEALKIPGLVLTWEKTSTRLGSIYGHTAITTGDGHSSTSDFIERNTLAGAASRSGLKIFVPIV